MGKILVVEDDKGILANIKILLTSEDFEVETATNGLEALRKIEVEEPDLILSDVMMPYLDGIELFKRVKNDYKLIHVPFIFLTAKSDQQSMRNALGLGASDYLTKPFETEDLVNSIKVRLEHKSFLTRKFNDIQSSFDKFVPHELRSPLLPILGFSDILKNDADSLTQEEVKEIAEKINWSGNRLLNRIEKFMTAHEVFNLISEELEKMRTQTTEFSEEMVTNLIKNHYLIKNEIENIKIEIEKAAIKIKEPYLIIVLRELLENAQKFNTPSKKISLVGKTVGDTYEISIKNEGFGMRKDEIANIGLFTQFNRTKTNQEGNGLGLAIVQKIIELFGNNFKIESEPNSYTEVKICFNV